MMACCGAWRVPTRCELGQLVSEVVLLPTAACSTAASVRKDGQPGQHCPQAILFPVQHSTLRSGQRNLASGTGRRRAATLTSLTEPITSPSRQRHEACVLESDQPKPDTPGTCRCGQDFEQGPRDKVRAYAKALLAARQVPGTDACSVKREALGAYCMQRQVCSVNLHLTWSEPVPKLSSPHSEQRLSSMRLPKNFQPVGTS